MPAPLGRQSSEDVLSLAPTTRPSTPLASDAVSEGETAPISVVIRVRPLTATETKAGQSNVWKNDAERIWQAAPGRTSSAVPPQVYTFDRIFNQNESTAVLYEACARARVARVLQGYNATVFAYGQTSSGKTTTVRGMAGQEGLIPLCTRQLLHGVAEAGRVAWAVRMSYMEIYNESIGDLLTGQTGLNVYEKKGGGILVQDLREELLTDWEQAEKLLLRGDENRHIGCTSHNDKSSRAHTVFRLRVDAADAADGAPLFSSELNLVDLAGSERGSPHSRGGGSGGGGRDVRMQEGGHINKSLLALSTVIQKLSEGFARGSGTPSHVPYRSAKITRILQNSLGGDALSTVVCNVTPASGHCEETHNTLRFALRARSVRTAPQRQEATAAPAAALRRAEAELRELRLALAAARREAAAPREPLMPVVSVASQTPREWGGGGDRGCGGVDSGCGGGIVDTGCVGVGAGGGGGGGEGAGGRDGAADASAVADENACDAVSTPEGRPSGGAGGRGGRTPLTDHNSTMSDCSLLEEALAAQQRAEERAAAHTMRSRALEEENALLRRSGPAAVGAWGRWGGGVAKAAGGTESTAEAKEPGAEMTEARQLVAAAEAQLRMQTERTRQLEAENARLLQRVSLALQPAHGRLSSSAANDKLRWRHKYMVELLRRSSLERRNEQLKKQVIRLGGGHPGRCDDVPPELPELWEDVGNELPELVTESQAPSTGADLSRLRHLDLAGL